MGQVRQEGSGVMASHTWELWTDLEPGNDLHFGGIWKRLEQIASHPLTCSKDQLSLIPFSYRFYSSSFITYFFKVFSGTPNISYFQEF